MRKKAAMTEERYITITSDRREIILGISSILYVQTEGRHARIRVSDGRIFDTRTAIAELEGALGDGFLRAHRGLLVSVRAIHDITDTINLSNGDRLEYTRRRRGEILRQFRAKQRSLIREIPRSGCPATPEEYREHYRGFEALPFAFTDIEMVFNEECRAVDWIFRYGNPALARLEKLPLERLIDSSFGSLFPNMDAKWLRSYERATLYGETLELIDYSPEIDTDLKVICFPTFPGHCGCILFELTQIRFTAGGSDAGKALRYYFGGLSPQKL